METQQGISDYYHIQVTPQRYTIDVNENLLTYRCIQDIQANTMALSTFSCINAFRNVNRFYNQIRVKIGQSTYAVFIPQELYSFWDIFDLISIIQDQMNAQIPGSQFVITLGGNNNKFVTIANNQQFTLDFSHVRDHNQLTKYLGYGNGQQPAFYIPSTTQTARFPYNVQVTSQINLAIKNFSFNSESLGVIAQIPLSAPITQIITYQSATYESSRQILVRSGTMSVSEIVIQLQDDEGNGLSIEDNRMSMTFICERFSKLK